MSWRELSSLVRYDVTEGASAITLRLAGEVDLVSSSQLVALIEHVGRELPRVVLDLRRVTFLDARGLSLLLLGAQRLRELGGDLALRQPHPAVRRLLQLFGSEVALAVEEPATFLDPTPEVVAICNEAVEAAIGASGATTSHLRLADAAGALRIVAERNILPAAHDYFEVVDSTECAAGAAWATKNMVHVPDITRSPIFLGTPSLEVVRDVGIRSVGSIPLWDLEGQAVGTFSVGSAQAGEWSHKQKRQLRLLASATSRLLAEQAS